jgi:VWFA-related protein
MKRLALMAAIAGGVLLGPACAQEPGETAKIAVSARLVTVPTVVRDKRGELVGDLKRENFVLKVDGKVQAIRYFDHDTDVPLTLGLMVDTSMSQRVILDDEKTASTVFLDKMLAPADRAFVTEFDYQVRTLVELTEARPALEAGLAKVACPVPKVADVYEASAGRMQNRIAIMQARREALHAVVGTKLFDAVVEAAEDVTGKQTGRKALILLTDGGDHGSDKTMDEAIEAAQRADTVIYAIYYVAPPGTFRQGLFDDAPDGTRPGGEPPPPGAGNHFAGGGDGDGQGPFGGLFAPHDDGKKILEKMTAQTGGRMFEVGPKLTVEQIYARIAEELRAQYRLGFTPSGATGAKGYHKVSVSVTGVDGKQKAQTRAGYYAGH